MKDAVRRIALCTAGSVGIRDDPLDPPVAQELGVFEDGASGRALSDFILDILWEPAKDVREDVAGPVALVE